MKLSIVIPVFNEENSAVEVIQRVEDVKIPDYQKEIIIVNDGSSDKTGEVIERFLKKNKFSNTFFYEHKKNMGKGAAVRTGFEHATGDYIVIQDADTEYNPNDIPKLLDPITRKEAKVVFGTRLNRLPHFLKEEHNGLFLSHYFGNRFLSLITSILYFQWITDMETCYKVFPRSAVSKMKLYARGFEFEPEITAKLLKQGFKIKEIPITTKPRGYDEGKKLNAMKEGPVALWTLFKYRFLN